MFTITDLVINCCMCRTVSFHSFNKYTFITLSSRTAGLPL